MLGDVEERCKKESDSSSELSESDRNDSVRRRDMRDDLRGRMGSVNEMVRLRGLTS